MKEVLQQAIDFAEYCLEELDLSYMASNQAKRLIEKSKEALAKQEQGEPVAKVKRNSSGQIYIEWRDGEFAIANLVEAKLYTTPQQRKPLTDEQIELAENQIWNTDQLDEVERQANKEFVRAIEAAHGIKE